MARTPLSRPTDGELAILRVLWQRGPSTVREIYEVIADGRPAAYTTTLKLLQIMTEKGLTTREEWGRLHRYAAAAPQEETQRQLVEDLVVRAFGGSAAQLMVQALASERVSSEELAEIRALLQRKRGSKR